MGTFVIFPRIRSKLRNVGTLHLINSELTVLTVAQLSSAKDSLMFYTTAMGMHYLTRLLGS